MIKNNPLISIITVVYNNKNKIGKTIESIINQTYPNIEYIIIDGKSTDGTIDVIKHYESKITKWVSEPDTGIYNAMNKGIRIATGKYIQFLNSGDFFLENDVIEKIFSVERIADILYGNSYLSLDKKKIVHLPDSLSMYNFFISTISHQSSFIKKQLFSECQYDEQYKIVSDWKFFLQKIVFENCSTQHIDFPICFYDEIGVSSLNMKLHIEERIKTLNEMLPSLILKDYEELHQFRMLKNRRVYQYLLKYFVRM